jgi:hypothetical protein
MVKEYLRKGPRNYLSRAGERTGKEANKARTAAAPESQGWDSGQASVAAREHCTWEVNATQATKALKKQGCPETGFQRRSESFVPLTGGLRGVER